MWANGTVCPHCAARPTVIDGVNRNIDRETRTMTDEHYGHRHVGPRFANHGTTRHSADQYVDPNDRTIHSNTVEGYFSIFQAQHEGRLPALRREAPAPVPC